MSRAVCWVLFLAAQSAAYKPPSFPPDHRHFVDQRGYRTWPKCHFNSITRDPLDQLVFHLYGGRAPNMLSFPCSTWSAGCPCAAPLDLVDKGTFVEIGANDGLHMSNTYFFERFLGWRGLCVEANPKVYERLKLNRPNCTNANALVATPGYPGQKKDYIALFRPNDQSAEKHNRLSMENDWETGLSGLADSPKLKNVTDIHRFARRFNVQAKRYELPVVAFSTLFREHGITYIDFLSVDVEGASETVLRSIDFDAVQIKLIAVEDPDASTVSFLAGHEFRSPGIRTSLGDHLFINHKVHVHRNDGLPWRGASREGRSGRGRE